MKDEIVKYDTAVLAKEKGFNIPTKLCHNDDVNSIPLPYDAGNQHHTNDIGIYYSAPTQSLLQRWLREVYGIMVFVGYSIDGYTVQSWTKEQLEDVDSIDFDYCYIEDTYESALERGLLEALKLIE